MATATGSSSKRANTNGNGLRQIMKHWKSMRLKRRFSSSSLMFPGRVPWTKPYT
ncbi:conserved hypothetical protein [Ricinus communis]|uniref:Uncharacterized protein n=1 Tax=Ricinus communis TaxID=3988 RepID=B9RHT9_RICCO|nr:conserved hypothetical protein [Ricinus communis]